MQSFNNYQNIYLNIEEKTGPPIGIDLGTSYCCMAVVRGVTESPEVIMGHEGLSKIPSYVSFPLCDEVEIEDEDNYEINVGEFAESFACENPKGTIFDINRLIGRKFNDPRIQHDRQLWPFDIIEERGELKVMTGPNTSQYPSEIVAELIKWLKETADDYLGYIVKSAVIAVPVNFSQHHRELLTKACEQAGLQILQLVTQPTAAAVAYSLPKISNIPTYSKNGLIFDLGGGTLDLAFFEVTEGQVYVKAIGGDDHLGGRDIDNNLAHYCIQQFFIMHGINLIENKTVSNPTESLNISKRLRRLQVECERQKLKLSHTNQIIISVDCIYNDLDMRVIVTREIFDEINMGLFKRCIKVLRSFLENHSIPKKRIDDVVIIGGSSRIPRIKKLLSDFFREQPFCRSVDPEKAVALGAASLAFNAHKVGVLNILIQGNVSILQPFFWTSSCKTQEQGSRGLKNFDRLHIESRSEDVKVELAALVPKVPTAPLRPRRPPSHQRSIEASSDFSFAANKNEKEYPTAVQQCAISNFPTNDEGSLSVSWGSILVQPNIQFSFNKKPDIGIYITANTFQIARCKESNVQSFTKLIAIPPEIYFADQKILIEFRAASIGSPSFVYERFFNIFQLMNSPEIQTHRINIQGTKFTLCTAHIIAAFFHQVFKELDISGDGKIIVTLPHSKTYSEVEKIRKSLNILGYFNIRILPSLVTTAVASLDTLGYYKNVETKAPFRKYIFVLDFQMDSFSMAILQMLPKRISVISSRRSESFAACQTEEFARYHADWYKGNELPQEWKDYIQIVYELLIDPFADISLQAYAKFEAVVINESKASPSFVKMVKEVLHVKFASLQIPQIEANSLLGASLLAAPLSRDKALGEVRILDPHMQVDATGLISKSLVLTTNIEGQEVKIENFTRQQFTISTDVTSTSKEQMEPENMFVLLEETSSQIEGDMLPSITCYYQFTVKGKRKKTTFLTSKSSISFEIISKENLDGFFSLSVVNMSDPNFEILLTKKENVVCSSDCVSPAFSEFERLISFY